MPLQPSGHCCDPLICLKLSRLELESFSLFIVNLLKSQRMLPVTIFSIRTSSFPGKSDFFFPKWELFPYISDEGEESPLTENRSKASHDCRGKDVIDHSYTLGHKTEPHLYRDPCTHVNNHTHFLWNNGQYLSHSRPCIPDTLSYLILQTILRSWHCDPRILSCGSERWSTCHILNKS